MGHWPYVAAIRWQHTTTNQQLVCAVRRVCTRMGVGDEAYGRPPSQCLLGHQIEQHKNNKKKMHMVLDGCGSKTAHTTINQNMWVWQIWY